MKNIAIVCVAYNREKSLSRLLSSLQDAYYNCNVDLIISIDKSNNINVAKVADAYNWPFGSKRVIKHEKNLGLRKHVLGVGDFLNEYDGIIVLEDDLTVSPNFYSYAQQAADFFWNDMNIAGISLYSFAVNYQTYMPFTPEPSEYDTYFMKCAQSWGQLWLKNQWAIFKEWYNKNDGDFSYNFNLPVSICSWSAKSWLKYHTRYCIEENKYFIYPYQSFTSNHSDSGTHVVYSSPSFQTVNALFPKNKIFVFPKLEEASVRYDGFYENEALYHSLNSITSDDVCIDLCGSKNNSQGKRYLLSTRKLKYKVIKQYGLSFRPIEINVIKNVAGEGIFLYDTNSSAKEYPLFNMRYQYAYLNGVEITHVVKRLYSYGLISLFKTFFELFYKKTNGR